MPETSRLSGRQVMLRQSQRPAAWPAGHMPQHSTNEHVGREIATPIQRGAILRIYLMLKYLAERLPVSRRRCDVWHSLKLSCLMSASPTPADSGQQHICLLYFTLRPHAKANLWSWALAMLEGGRLAQLSAEYMSATAPEGAAE